MASGSGSVSLSNSVMAWINSDGSIQQIQLDGCDYDRPVFKHVKLDYSMKLNNLCGALFKKNEN